MARRRNDHWLLIRLAAQNVARRRLRAIFLGVAVMLGVGIGFASFVAGWALRDGMATSFSRMGADLVAVPRATLVNITASLLTVQPTDETLADGLAFVSDTAGILHCLDARTGKTFWSHDLMAAAWSTPLIAGGRVYVADEDGDIAVFEVGKAKKLLAESMLDAATLREMLGKNF